MSSTLGQIPTRYSPVRHSSAPSKLGLLPFDLHVLGMPPAFNLSQDQTLELFKLFAPLSGLIFLSLVSIERPHVLHDSLLFKDLRPLRQSAYSSDFHHFVNPFFRRAPLSRAARFIANVGPFYTLSRVRQAFISKFIQSLGIKK